MAGAMVSYQIQRVRPAAALPRGSLMVLESAFCPSASGTVILKAGPSKFCVTVAVPPLITTVYGPPAPPMVPLMVMELDCVPGIQSVVMPLSWLWSKSHQATGSPSVCGARAPAGGVTLAGRGVFNGGGGVTVENATVPLWTVPIVPSLKLKMTVYDAAGLPVPAGAVSAISTVQLPAV